MAEVRKKRYDVRVNEQARLKPGQLVYYFCPRRYPNKTPKWQKMFTGPYIVVREIDSHVIVIRKSPRSKAFTVHRNKLKVVQQEVDFQDFGNAKTKTITALSTCEAPVTEDGTVGRRPKRDRKSVV